MVNSLQYILQKRGMKQSQLVTKNLNGKKIIPQLISKYIHRQRIIPKDVEFYFENCLKVPANYFVDDKKRCKLLNEIELLALNEFLQEHPVSTLYEKEAIEKINCFNKDDRIKIERQLLLDRNLRKLQKNIRKNIYTYDNGETEEQALNTFESNLGFYETILRLRNNQKIQHAEWRSITYALSCFDENVPSASVENGTQLAIDIYNAIKRYRNQQEQQNKEYLDLMELWEEQS